MDECCLAFDKEYSYQSKYQGQKYYTQMMYKTPSQVAAQEYSFEMNAHNRTLLSQIQRASRSADAMRLYPGAFSETLVQLMKEKKLSNKKLADASLVGERTIQRLRNEEEVLGLEKGELIGIEKGKSDTLKEQLKVKLGTLSSPLEKQLTNTSLEKLNELTLNIFNVTSEEDVLKIIN